MSLVITGAVILDGVADRPLEGQSIWIEGTRIKAIGRAQELSVPKDAQILDERGKFVIPGLMDANVHLVGDIRMEHLIRNETRFEEVMLEGAQVALKAGVTTVFDTWGPRTALIATRDRITAGRAIGSRIFCAGNIIGLDGPFSADFLGKAAEAVVSRGLIDRMNSLFAENVGPDLTWMTPGQVAEEVKAYLSSGIDFVKYASNEHRSGETNSFLLFSPRVQERIIEEAHRAGTTAQAHTTSVEGLRVATEAGSDIIQHCNLTGPVPIPKSTLEIMLRRKTNAVVFPLTRRRLAIFRETADAMTRRFWHTCETNCRALIQSGVTLLLGTDAALMATSDSRFRGNLAASGEDNLMEMGAGHFHWLTAMEEMGLAPMAGLKAATSNIAAAYGKAHELGSLTPGKMADLLVLDENPLEAAKNYQSIRAVIKDGQIVDTDALPTTPILTKPVLTTPGSQLYGRFAASGYPCCGH